MSAWEGTGTGSLHKVRARGTGWAREGASGGSLKGSAEPNESEALHEASNPEGKLANGSELNIRRQVGV